MTALHGADIAAFLGQPLRGGSLPIAQPGDLVSCGPGDLVWVRKHSVEGLALLRDRQPALCICDAETARAAEVPTVEVERPRLDFIRVLQAFFAPRPAAGEAAIHPSAIIDPRAQLGLRVRVGAYARIGAQALIGDDCIIGAGVHIEGAVQLGQRCIIKPNSVLGGQGFGFEYDEDGAPLHFPHLGRIVVEDDVWIGACSTVELAALGTTLICRGVKIDDLVQIGHNTTIGANTLVMANVVFCGGSRVGAGCWIAPGTLVKQKVVIGDNVTVGLGGVVLSDVQDGAVVAGVPTRPLTKKS